MSQIWLHLIVIAWLPEHRSKENLQLDIYVAECQPLDLTQVDVTRLTLNENKLENLQKTWRKGEQKHRKVVIQNPVSFEGKNHPMLAPATTWETKERDYNRWYFPCTKPKTYKPTSLCLSLHTPIHNLVKTQANKTTSLSHIYLLS